MNKQITRREALKYMGGALAGAAALSTMGSLLSCNQPQSNSAETAARAKEPQAPAAHSQPRRLLFYFTGTGHSLYVARELSANIISIPQALKKGKLSFAAEEIGIVYPVYGHMPPNMVRTFLEKAQLKCAYLFAVLTYGNRKASAAEICAQIGKESGHLFDYIATIIMVDNWLPAFDMAEQKKIDKHISTNLARIKGEVDARKKALEAVSAEERQQHQELLARGTVFTKEGIKARAEEWFTVTDNCIACGICSRICPRANYSFQGEKVAAQGECELCLACVHNCPHKAIILTKGEKNYKARYRHPAVSVSDIQRANSQI